MRRGQLNALSVFVVGLALTLLLLAPSIRLYGLGIGLTAMVATLEIGTTLRTYLSRDRIEDLPVRVCGR